MPRSRHTELGRARIRWQPADGMPLARGSTGVHPCRTQVRRGVVGATLDPHLLHDVAPGREQADAVADRHDLVQRGEQCRERQLLVDHLGDLVGRLDPQGERSDEPQATERDDRAGKSVRIV